MPIVKNHWRVIFVSFGVFLGSLSSLSMASETASDVQPGPRKYDNKVDQKEGPIQGRYRLEFGFARPSFSSAIEHYDELYGNPQFYPTIAFDRAFWNLYVTIGLGGRFGIYKESGFAADSSSGEVTKDKESDNELTLIPLQAVAIAHMSPVPGRWLVLNFWAGPENLYVQEIRNPIKGEGSASESTDAVYVNSGWNLGVVSGASASIRLDPLEDESVSSLSILGFRSVYITPFIEVVKSTKGTGLFSRRNAGILFTFESML